VLDGFLINDELDLLELRLMELDPIVDQFVAIQMDRNFRGEPKPCHLSINDERWEKWRHKMSVLSIVEQDFGPHPDAEWTQRRTLIHGFASAEPGDLLMLSDVDEIPSRKVIDRIKGEPPDSPVTLVTRLYYYGVDLRMCRPWAGTVVWPHGCVRGEPDLQDMRTNRHFFPQIPDSGWHFSWMGDSTAVLRKLGNLDVSADAKIFGGGIDDIPGRDDIALVNDRVGRGIDLFNRQDAASSLIQVPIEPGIGHPHEILEWLDKHPSYVRSLA
jgi:beta-1,4-mannosyl-glycoprotein beta-1,4-N-acetylglucosaminyltransferase